MVVNGIVFGVMTPVVAGNTRLELCWDACCRVRSAILSYLTSARRGPVKHRLFLKTHVGEFSDKTRIQAIS